MASLGKDMLVIGPTDDEELLGREYLRVSYDRSGRERSNSEQQDDNRAAWSRLSFGEH